MSRRRFEYLSIEMIDDSLFALSLNYRDWFSIESQISLCIFKALDTWIKKNTLSRRWFEHLSIELSTTLDLLYHWIIEIDSQLRVKFDLKYSQRSRSIREMNRHKKIDTRNDIACSLWCNNSSSHCMQFARQRRKRNSKSISKNESKNEEEDESKNEMKNDLKDCMQQILTLKDKSKTQFSSHQ